MSVPGSLPTHPDSASNPSPVARSQPSPRAPVSSQPTADLPHPTIAPVARLIERYRGWLLGLCVLVQLACFNGQWRIGTDSPHYRGLGNALATGQGYEFGEFATNTIYPGLPLLLAALQKAFGFSMFSPWQSVLAMTLAGLASLFVVYQLVRLHYPVWIATAVTCGVAINSRFVQLCHELLTDIPFFLGLVVAVLGWELLRRADSRGRFVRALLISAGGLMLAASMRPTFWILAVAWIGVSAWELIRKQWKPALASIGVLVAVVIAVVALDPRTRGWRFFEGGYEQEFLAVWADAGTGVENRLPTITDRVPRNIPRLLGENFPEAFIGQEAPWGGNWVVSAVLLIASAAMIRRHPLWTTTVFGTVCITLMLTTTPRYYLMVLPFLLVAWVCCLQWLACRTGRLGGWVLLAGLGFVTVMNVAKVFPFAVEQRKTPFLTHYRHGRYLPAIAIAEQIRRHVPGGERLIGPNAPVLRFLSGRQVMMQREVLPPRKSPKLYPKELAKEKITWGVLPGEGYREDEPDLGKMIDRRIIRSTGTVAEAGGMRLARIRVYPPPVEDWRTIPIEVARASAVKKPAPTTRRTAEQRAALERRLLKERRAAAAARAAKLAAAERRAANERKAIRERRAELEAKKAAQARRAAAERRAVAQRRAAVAARQARLEKLEKERKKSAAAARAAKARKARKAATRPATQGASSLQPHRSTEFLVQVYNRLASA